MDVEVEARASTTRATASNALAGHRSLALERVDVPPEHKGPRPVDGDL